MPTEKVETTIADIDERLQIVERETFSLGMEFGELQARVSHALQQMEKTLAAMRRDLTALDTRIASLEASRTATGMSPGKDWYTAWKRKTAPRHLKVDEMLIEIMGETGSALREQLVPRLYAVRAIRTDDPSSGGARRPFERLLKWEIIGKATASREGVRGGRKLEFFWLTERGRRAYQFLTGIRAVESEYTRLLARHKGPEHVWLNMLAGKILQQWAEVQWINPYPEPYELLDDSTFDCDIEVWLSDGQQLLVECERRVRGKASGSMQRKWELYQKATQRSMATPGRFEGQFYIVVPNQAVEQRVRHSLNRWAQHEKVNLHLRICTASVWNSQIAAGKRKPTDAPWTFGERYSFQPWF